MCLTTALPTTLSAEARCLYEQHEGQPFLINDWLRCVFIHYEAAPELLQQVVPFELDVYEGRAYVSLVAFTMRRLRVTKGGRLLNWAASPFATHGFLNVRTYVKHNDERGIYFLAEWLDSRLSSFFGPRMYGLPFRYGRLRYRHNQTPGCVAGQVSAGAASRGGGDKPRLRYTGRFDEAASFVPCDGDTLGEFLLERYVAFTKRRGTVRQFRVWHEPWPVTAIEVAVRDASLLGQTGLWARDARIIGGHYSPGARDVWMSRPRCISGPACGIHWPRPARMRKEHDHG